MTGYVWLVIFDPHNLNGSIRIEGCFDSEGKARGFIDAKPLPSNCYIQRWELQ